MDIPTYGRYFMPAAQMHEDIPAKPSLNQVKWREANWIYIKLPSKIYYRFMLMNRSCGSDSGGSGNLMVDLLPFESQQPVPAPDYKIKFNVSPATDS